MIKLKKGDRIRLKVKTWFGWKGLGTVLLDQFGETVCFIGDECSKPYRRIMALRSEVVKLRRQEND